MYYFNYYYKIITKQDIINRFHCKNANTIPKIKKIILSFRCKNQELKELLPSLIALELITLRKGILTRIKKTKINLKIKQGTPIGCKVTIRKYQIYNFIHKVINEIFPKLKQFKHYNFAGNSHIRNKTLTITFSNTLDFSELETNYSYFKNLPNLKITIITNTKQFTEIAFLLKSLKIPINI